MRSRTEEASEEQKDLARLGLEIYNDTTHGRITPLFQAMFKDNRVVNLIGGDTWEAVRDALGPLRVKKDKRGKPSEEEANQLLDATLNLWRRVENQSD